MLTHLSGVAHLHLNRPLNLSSHQWNPKVMVQYIGRHWNCFLSSNGKDGHELKLETAGPTFSSFNAIPAKITPPTPPPQKNSRLMLSDGLCLKPCLQLYSSIFLIEDITRCRKDMNFIFAWQKQYFTHSRMNFIFEWQNERSE